MKLEIRNLESVLPLFQITKTGIISVLNTDNKVIEENVLIKKENRGDDGFVRKIFQEGGTREIIIEMQKRDNRLRAQAIELYGYNCCICGFNFEKVYGDLGVGYIEVHHLIPLSTIKSERTDTVDDVCVVCANCHRILHHNGSEPIPVDELRKIVERRRT